MRRRSTLIGWLCSTLVLTSAPAAFASGTVHHHHHRTHKHAVVKHRPAATHTVAARHAAVSKPAAAPQLTPAPTALPSATAAPALVAPVIATALPTDTASPEVTAPVATPSPADTTPPATTDVTAPVSAPAAPVASGTAPVEVNITPGILRDDAQLNHALDMAQAAGAVTIYTVVNWFSTQPTADGGYQWYDFDRLVAATKARGLGLRFQITGTPDWVHPDLAATVGDAWKRQMTPATGPGELALWKTFVGDVAARYGNAVSRMEIWNEPNIPDFFQPAPDAAHYVQILKAGYEAVKAVAPQVQVLFGGLSRNDVGYLQKFYAAADAVPGAPANHWFDVLDVHPYCGNRAPSYNSSTQVWNGPNGLMDENFLGFERLHDVMLSHGEDKHIFLGEFGYSTVANQWTAATTDVTRAGYLTEAYRLAGALSYVDGMNWYSFIANPWDGPEWTLLSSSLAPTATYDALVALPK